MSNISFISGYFWRTGRPYEDRARRELIKEKQRRNSKRIRRSERFAKRFAAGRPNWR